MAFKATRSYSLGPFSGLRARIVLLIAALTLLMVVLFGLVVSRLLEHHLVVQKRAQGRTILLAMQANFDLLWESDPSGSVGFSDKPAMARFVRIMANDLELNNLILVDRDRNVIAHNRQELIGLSLDDEEVVRAIEQRVLVHRLEGRGDVLPELIFSGPFYQAGRVAGAVRFSLPVNDIYSALRDTRRVLLLYALLDALVVIFVGSLILWWLLVKPVDKLLAVTERMAGGDYAVAFPANIGGEIGRLARTLSSLANTLRDREAIAGRQLENLEKINEELKNAHDQLLHSDRLAYVGRVAAGVAHEVGNPLGAIYGYLEILRDSEVTGQDRDILQRLEGEIRRIDHTMRELLDFSRDQRSSSQLVDLLEITGKTVDLMKSQRGLDRVTVEITLQDSPPVRLDPQQFEQVLLNVLLNAADAMDGRGNIRIETAVGPFDRVKLMEAQLPGAPPEDRAPFTDMLSRGIRFAATREPAKGAMVVELRVTDDGPGMSSGILERCFDPFYTTKEVGRGTGLGLSICQRLVAAAGGFMRLESRPGVGTRVSLIYPIGEKESTDG